MDIDRHVGVIAMRCKPLIKEQRPFMAWAFDGGHGIVLTGAVERLWDPTPVPSNREGTAYDAKPLTVGPLKAYRNKLKKILKDPWRAVTVEWAPEFGLILDGDPRLCEELKARLS